MPLPFLFVVAVASLVWLPGCTSVTITPQKLAARPAGQGTELQRWNEAVWICNEFLGSDSRQTLPPGRLRLVDDGMEFVGADFSLPCRVRCTTWGGVLVQFKMIAQERADGFVVGLTQPGGDRLVDNSFFQVPGGKPRSNLSIAALILHELTHSYYKLGTVDFFTGLRYYAEAVVRFTYRKHSMERLPYRTSAEFRAFAETFVKEHAEPDSPAPAAPEP